MDRCPECGQSLYPESHGSREPHGEYLWDEWYECCNGHKFHADELDAIFAKEAAE